MLFVGKAKQKCQLSLYRDNTNNRYVGSIRYQHPCENLNLRLTNSWLVCCHIQVSAVDSLDGPLLQVEGLGDLRLELHSKKLNIHLVLIDELHRHLYIKSTSRLGHKNKDKNAARLPG